MTKEEKNAIAVLVLRMYSMTREEYEMMIDEGASESWQLPYMYIQEYIPALIFVINKTLNYKAILKFWNYCYRKAPNDCKISKQEYYIVKTIIRKELDNREFCESLRLFKTYENIRNDLECEIIDETKFCNRSKIFLDLARKFISEEKYPFSDAVYALEEGLRRI